VGKVIGSIFFPGTSFVVHMSGTWLHLVLVSGTVCFLDYGKCRRLERQSFVQDVWGQREQEERESGTSRNEHYVKTRRTYPSKNDNENGNHKEKEKEEQLYWRLSLLIRSFQDIKGQQVLEEETPTRTQILEASVKILTHYVLPPLSL
jgi:hypothetical protein